MPTTKSSAYDVKISALFSFAVPGSGRMLMGLFSTAYIVRRCLPSVFLLVRGSVDAGD